MRVKRFSGSVKVKTTTVSGTAVLTEAGQAVSTAAVATAVT
jgi:hypothetical protein